MEKRNATVAVIGAGDFIGAEISKKFASQGFTVFVGRRQGEKLQPLVDEIEAAGGSVVARGLDARKEEEVNAFLQAADQHAPLEVCIFNIGANVSFPIVDTTERVFRKVWEMACYSGFLAGRESARLMLQRGKGNIFFTGATASMRGGSGFAAFASAKFGLRALAQSMARELGPKNIHVAPPRDRRIGGHRLGARTDRRPGGRTGAGEPEPGPPDAALGGGRELLGAVPAAADGVDLRTGNPALRREVVTRRHLPWPQPWRCMTH